MQKSINNLSVLADKNPIQINIKSFCKENFKDETESKIEFHHGWPSPPGLPHRAVTPTKGTPN